VRVTWTAVTMCIWSAVPRSAPGTELAILSPILIGTAVLSPKDVREYLTVVRSVPCQSPDTLTEHARLIIFTIGQIGNI
jgi:hypothetical protein